MSPTVNVHLLALLLAFGLGFGACTTQQVPPAPAVTALDAEAFVERAPTDGLVIDVRRPDEVAQGRLAGALNANLQADDFEAVVSGLDRQTPVYLYCRSGNRSGQAAEIMQAMGFRTIYNIGGYESLRAAGAEVVE